MEPHPTASGPAALVLAPAPGPARLVVIVLRGGMDGLTAVAPYGDPDFAALARAGRPGHDGYTDLDGYFALHPGLAPLLPLWQAGDLAVVHAVATPYRDQRSHFDGQDILEFGQTGLPSGTARSGWLNRVLEHIPGAHPGLACAVGTDRLPILSGGAEVHRWSPDIRLSAGDRLQSLCLQATAPDARMTAALRSAFATQAADTDPDRTAEDRVAAYVAARLNEDARIAAFAIDGWDTHSFQDRNFTRAMDRLTASIATLSTTLTAQSWARTTIVAMTEFGRTVRLNGTGGTDHGTAGAMLIAGGAIAGGRVFANWPGLSESDLYDRRDLFPTRDLRAYLGWILRNQFGLPASTVDTAIFPGLELGSDPGLI